MKNPKKYILSIIILGMSNLLFSQTELKVGDAAPAINITDYISNIPSDKNLKNKFILLEFWATWCGPCLQEVPNLNKLQEKYKSKKDFVFLSLTDEKPEKVLKTLKKIPFNSIVASDQTRKTLKSFVEKKDGTIYLPTTVLIDHNGIIKWIGNPVELNDVILDKFINGEELKASDNTTSNRPPPPTIVKQAK